MKNNKIMVVGITGLMGSGKSYVSNVFNTFGAILFNTDDVALYLQISNVELKNLLIDKFGSEYYIGNSINKDYVRNLVFDNTQESRDNLKWCTDTIGIYVVEYLKNYITTLIEKQINSYILVESAILFETGLDKICDYIICVKSPSPAISTIRRDNITKEDWEIRMSTQLDDDKKHFDYVVNNDYSSDLNNQVLEIHEQIMKNIS